MGHVTEKAGLFDCRDAWVKTLVDVAANDPRICAVVNDSVGSSKLGAFQKAFTSLDTRIRHLSNPLTADFMPLAGDIEDHASNLPLVTQKLAQMSDDLKYVYGMELIHACQAIDLRMRTNEKLRLGKATQKIWREFRKGIKLYESERPLAPDIQKAYEFVKELVNII